MTAGENREQRLSKRVYVIVNGTETQVMFSKGTSVRHIAETALKQTGNTGRPYWDFQFIHNDKTYGFDQNAWKLFKNNDVIFLSLRAGTGAAMNREQPVLKYGTREYIEELYRRLHEGGTVWLMERTDTHDFYQPSLQPHIHVFGRGVQIPECGWSKEIGWLVVSAGFLTKEDAEKHSWKNDGYDRHDVPVKITEHEFVDRGGKVNELAVEHKKP